MASPNINNLQHFPPPPHHHYIVMVVIIISLGGLLLLCCAALAILCCIAKKKQKQKQKQKSEVIEFDHHRNVKENAVETPDGSKAVMIGIEDDVHFAKEEILKKEEELKKGHHLHPHAEKFTSGSDTNVETGDASAAASHNHH